MASKKDWKKAKFPGVRYREHQTRRHGVRLDRYYTITYKYEGKTKTEAVGWASEGVRAEDAAHVLGELKKNKSLGLLPQTLKQKREMAAEELRSQEAEKAKDIALGDCWSMYLDHASRKKKESSWAKEESHFCIWLQPLLGDVLVRHIGISEFDMLVAELSDAGRSLRTIEYVTGTLRRFLKFCHTRGIVDHLPPSGKDIGATGPGDRNRRLALISLEQTKTILDELRERDFSAWRITTFAFLTGCRISEAFNLLWQHVDFERKKVVFVQTKNNDTRELPLTDLLLEVLGESGENDEYVFTGKRGRPYREAPAAFREVVEGLGYNDGKDRYNKISFHSIRHSVATELAKSLTVRDLMDVMGWKTVQMAMRYVKGDVNSQGSALEGLAGRLE